MKRADSGFAQLLFLLVSMPLMFAQNLGPNPRPAPVQPLQTLGPQLIAWSALQEPQPLRQTPAADGVEQSGAAETQILNPSDSQSAGAQQTTPQYFTGTVEDDAGRYVLRVSRYSTFELDNQQTAKQYVGLQVRITATVDPNGENLRIISVKPLS